MARSGDVTKLSVEFSRDSSLVNSINENGVPLVIIAAYRGHQPVVELLYRYGANLNVCSSEGNAVMGLIYKNNQSLMAYLFASGVSPNDTCQFKQYGYPLHFAMTLKRYELIKLMLQKGASTSVVDPMNRSISELLLFYKDESLNIIFHDYVKK